MLFGSNSLKWPVSCNKSVVLLVSNSGGVDIFLCIFAVKETEMAQVGSLAQTQS